MQKLLLPAFCLLHILAISWWTLPHSFNGLLQTESERNTFTAKVFNAVSFAQSPMLTKFFSDYVNLTGSQQYWDFFAPQSVKTHQYLSVCDDITLIPDKAQITCTQQPLFSNFADDFAEFRLFGSDRSRWYRLTENLINQNDEQLLTKFADYYRTKASNQPEQVYLISHQFELHPELVDLPKAGYRTDSLLMTSP